MRALSPPEHHHPKLDDIPQEKYQNKQSRRYPVPKRESGGDCPAEPLTAHPMQPSHDPASR